MTKAQENEITGRNHFINDFAGQYFMDFTQNEFNKADVNLTAVTDTGRTYLGEIKCYDDPGHPRPFSKYKDYQIDYNKIDYLVKTAQSQGRIPILYARFQDITLVWNLTNMLPWSSSRSSARELKDNVAKLNIQLEMLERNTELEVRTASDTLAQCKKAIEASERNITLAQRSYDMTWQAYRNGTTEYLDLKEAENQLNQAKLSLVSEKFNYMTSLMDLEYKLNTTLTGDK